MADTDGLDIFDFKGKQGAFGFKDTDTGVLTFSKGTGDDAGTEEPLTLVQNWSVQYQQSATPIYECGTSTVYWAVKHASGSLTIGRIVAEDPTTVLTKLGKPCDPSAATLNAFTAGCNINTSEDNPQGGNGGGVSLAMKGLVATSIGFGGQAQNAYVTEDIQAMFASLGISGKKQNSTPAGA